MGNFWVLQEIFVNVFFLFAQVVDIIVFLDSLIGGLALGDEIEVIVDENKESNAHDCTHHNDEEEEGFHHEQVLKSQQVIGFDDLVPNPKRIVPESHFQQGGVEGHTANDGKVAAPD